MKILFSSYTFWPNVGGTERVGAVLAEQFVEFGHAVRVITHTAAYEERPFTYPVLRNPSPAQLIAQLHWCDIFFHNNICLQDAWALGFRPKPWVIAHHTWLCRPDGSRDWQDHLKRRLVGAAFNVAVSSAIAAELSTPAEVIPNPYRADLFRTVASVTRDRDLVFLGRLVSDKGADLLLDALADLRESGIVATLTVIGDGPEKPALERQATALNLTTQVEFVGVRSGQELVRSLNGHRILVVPSRWREPFGLVALEGIACGCAVVAADGGGLIDAVGPCGVTFRRGDATRLAEALAPLLQGARLETYREAATAHLARHRPEVIGKDYLRVLAAACGLAVEG